MDLDFIRHRITQLRLSRQMSEYQLSLELGQCKSYIQGITSGKSLPSVKQLYNICDFFGSRSLSSLMKTIIAHSCIIKQSTLCKTWMKVSWSQFSWL